MKSISGKKLLILAGASVHCKLVKAAKEMGVYSIVTDNVPNSPAKKIADKSYDINIFDIKGLEKICKEEHVDGVLGCYIDPCQIPYNELCEKLGFPCYGTQDQFFHMTNKRAFKQMCIENGVNIIQEFSEDKTDKIEYPVFVKPVDSRGSRGQTTCYNKEDLKKAIAYAKTESTNGCIIEKCMKEAGEFQVTYFFQDGQSYLLRTADSYCGSEANHMEKVVACAVSPSKYTDLYLQTTHDKVVKMFNQLGIKNGPAFMQGFVDNGVFRFFDPGLRFPGVDYDLIYNKVFHVDVIKAIILFSLSGACNSIVLPDDGVYMKGKRAAVLFPTIKSGVIASKKGESTIRNMTEKVISYLPRWQIGDSVPWTYNVNQRSAEIDILCNSTEDLCKTINSIQHTYRIFNQNGEDMTFELFDTHRIE